MGRHATTAHGRLMLTVLGGLAEFERELNPHSHRRGPRARQGERAKSRQLACADLAVLNKTDLIDPARLTLLRHEIEARLRPGVKLMTARDGRVPPEVVLGLAAAAEGDLAGRPSLHDLEAAHDHDDFESFVVTSDAVHDDTAFLSRLRATIDRHDVLRVKGFLARPGRDRRQVVQAVGSRVQHHYDRPWHAGERRETRLVVIGKKGLDRAAISAALGASD
jgi:cobalamin biosynthesis protein CobW